MKSKKIIASLMTLSIIGSSSLILGGTTKAADLNSTINKVTSSSQVNCELNAQINLHEHIYWSQITGATEYQFDVVYTPENSHAYWGNGGTSFLDWDISDASSFKQNKLGKYSLTVKALDSNKNVITEQTIYFYYDGSTTTQLNNETEQFNSTINKVVLNRKTFGNSFIIKNSGEVLACGTNIHGQLGLGDKKMVPCLVNLNINNIKDVATSTVHTIFLKKDGSVWAAGYNSQGELGLGDVNERLVPTQISIDNVKQVDVGVDTTYFLKNDGTVWGAGSNYECKLGLEASKKQALVPTKINIDNVKKVVCGGGSTFFLKNDGTIWAVGNNFYGQLGIGNNKGVSIPTEIPLNDIEDVAASVTYTIFLKKDGTAWATGQNSRGGMGLGSNPATNKPKLINLQNISKISVSASGSDHSIFLKNDGTVYACGSNNSGSLGLGGVYSDFYQIPTQVAINNIKDIVTGSDNSIFVKNDGTILGCGIYRPLGIDKSAYTTEIIPILQEIK